MPPTPHIPPSVEEEVFEVAGHVCFERAVSEPLASFYHNRSLFRDPDQQLLLADLADLADLAENRTFYKRAVNGYYSVIIEYIVLYSLTSSGRQ